MPRFQLQSLCVRVPWQFVTLSDFCSFSTICFCLIWSNAGAFIVISGWNPLVQHPGTDRHFRQMRYEKARNCSHTEKQYRRITLSRFLCSRRLLNLNACRQMYGGTCLMRPLLRPRGKLVIIQRWPHNWVELKRGDYYHESCSECVLLQQWSVVWDAAVTGLSLCEFPSRTPQGRTLEPLQSLLVIALICWGDIHMLWKKLTVHILMNFYISLIPCLIYSV